MVSSTWRFHDNYKQCLYDAGLHWDIEIIGRLQRSGKKRAIEIKEWLDFHNNFEIDNYVILDDECYCSFFNPIRKHIVRTDTTVGFLCNEYEKALNILKGNL